MDGTGNNPNIYFDKIRSEFRDEKKSFIIITHYQRMLNYLEPDYIHVLMNGKIVKSGDKSLALSLEEKGYDWIDG